MRGFLPRDDGKHYCLLCGRWHVPMKVGEFTILVCDKAPRNGVFINNQAALDQIAREYQRRSEAELEAKRKPFLAEFTDADDRAIKDAECAKAFPSIYPR